MRGQSISTNHPIIGRIGWRRLPVAVATDSGQAVALAWIRIAVAYLVIAVVLGLYMGVQGDHSLRSVHAHLNVFGWASFALMGLIYGQYPQISRNRFAQTHFWLQNLGLATMMLALAFKLSGYPQADPVLGAGSAIAALAVILFAANILFATRT
jgi:hypothetical protein